jgi:ubiquinone/menaquinone biosynthesis C-methylase UbiE
MAVLGAPEVVRNAVRERYGAVAREPGGAYNFRVGRQFAQELGYPADLLDDLPQSASEAFTGVAAASLLADPGPGETVVDLGAGGGLDLAVLARKVGPRGRAIGVDFAPDMVARARWTLRQLGLEHAEVLETGAEHTGLPDAHADLVVINGLLNLSPDKRAVLDEIARILRPDGRVLLAETTLRAPLAEGAVASLDDWFR